MTFRRLAALKVPTKASKMLAQRSSLKRVPNVTTTAPSGPAEPNRLISSFSSSTSWSTFIFGSQTLCMKGLHFKNKSELTASVWVDCLLVFKTGGVPRQPGKRKSALRRKRALSSHAPVCLSNLLYFTSCQKGLIITLLASVIKFWRCNEKCIWNLSLYYYFTKNLLLLMNNRLNQLTWSKWWRTETCQSDLALVLASSIITELPVLGLSGLKLRSWPRLSDLEKSDGICSRESCWIVLFLQDWPLRLSVAHFFSIQRFG